MTPSEINNQLLFPLHNAASCSQRLKQMVAGAEKNNSGSEEREVKMQSINHSGCN